MFLKLLTVASLATFEIYAAIPAGFAFGLSAWNIFLSSTIGGLIGVLVAAFLGDKIRAYFHKKKPTAETAKKGHPVLIRIWEKYGLMGLGFLGTIAVGAPVSVAVGVGLNANMRLMAAWCSLGVITRCIVFTYIGWYGLQLF